MIHDVKAVVERLLWHVEKVCGTLSPEPIVIEGDDDRSVLAHNFSAVLLDALSSQSPPQDGDEAEMHKAAKRWLGGVVYTPERAEAFAAGWNGAISALRSGRG